MNPFRQEADSQLDGMSAVNPWEGSPKPGFWAGTGFNESTDYLGPFNALARGAASGASKGAAVLTGLWGREYDVLGQVGEALNIPGASSSRDEAKYLQGLSEMATENAKRVLPDATTTGTAANILTGLGSGAELFLAGGGGLGGAVSVGGGEGTARKRELESQGVSEPVASAAGAVTGMTSALGAMMPGGFGSGLIKRILTGAASNTAFGMASRYADHLILQKGGYQEMADQQKVWDTGSMLADAVLGGGFGALSHLHAEPSQDAARTLNVANADRQSAPGVPTDAVAANAHQTALEKATTDMQQGKPVDVGSTNIREADFATRPAPEITEPMGWLAKSLKDTGVSDEEAELRRLDETLFQKTGERMVEPAIQAPADTAPVKPNPTAFTTAKGSTYTVTESGTTIRNKTFHPEHGPEDVGVQPESQRTFYVTPEDAEKLGEFQTQGGPKKSIAMVDENRAAVKYLEGESEGKFERRTVVDAQREPKSGLIPVELWKDGERVHFGNEITEVSSRAKSVGDPVSQALQERPELEVPNQRGGTERASEVLTRADAAVSTGSKELPTAAQAALNCFSRRS